MNQKCFLIFVALTICARSVTAYSAVRDAQIIAQYKREHSELNHAKIARQLVHQSNWAPVGTISTDSNILGFPMVNTISVDDSTITGESTGTIHFLLTDLDFTGKDWQKLNKVTFLFSDEMTLNCTNRQTDPMEPTCARAILSGKVIKMDVSGAEYNNTLNAFINRHPAAENWLKAHMFYLCELDIENIYILDFYGGPHNISTEDYYNINL